MIGDKLLFTKKQKIKAQKIAQIICEKNDLKKIVTISGISGSGKSEVAQLLREELFAQGYKVLLLSLDDYYKSSPKKRKEVRQQTGVIGSKEINWRKLKRITKTFKSNLPYLYVQQYDVFTDSIEHIKKSNKRADILIIEGLYAGYIITPFSFFLKTSFEQSYKFRKKRGKENPDDLFRQHVIKIENKQVLSYKQYVNTIIEE